MASCPMCGTEAKLLYRLRDQDAKHSGDYCSRDCAEADAWGPRFRIHTVAKLEVEDLSWLKDAEDKAREASKVRR